MSTLLTYSDLQSRVLRWVDEATDTDTTLTLVKDALNASHRRLITSRQWPFMAWPQRETFVTTSGVSFYALNPNSNRVYHLWDRTLRQYVPVIPRREWPAVGANRSNTATPPYGVTWGPNWPVKFQPAAVGTVSIVSSSASDVTSRGLVVTGVDAGGDIAQATLVAMGATPVVSTQTFAMIINLAKTGTWVGTLTLKDSGGNTLVSLGASSPGKQYPTVEFLEDPQPDRVCEYNFQRLPITLTNDGDIPETPYPYSEIHVYDALLDLTSYNTELGAKEQGLWTKRYTELMDGLVTSCDEEIVGAYPRFVRDLDDKGLGSRTSAYNL